MLIKPESLDKVSPKTVFDICEFTGEVGEESVEVIYKRESKIRGAVICVCVTVSRVCVQVKRGCIDERTCSIGRDSVGHGSNINTMVPIVTASSCTSITLT